MNPQQNEAGKLPDILDVVAAMEKVRAARPLASTEPLWWNEPSINRVLNAGAAAGYLHRLSTTQVEWTESGLQALQAVRSAVRNLPVSSEEKRAFAQAEFEKYDFGDGVAVHGHDLWETGDAANYTKLTYLEYPEDEPDTESHKVTFHVRFTPDGTVAGSYALEIPGRNLIGPHEAICELVLTGKLPGLRINVRQIADKLASTDDAEAAGIYVVLFDFDISGMSTEKLASIALDIFHPYAGIDLLDEFEIDAIDHSGTRVTDDDSHDATSWADRGFVFKTDAEAIDLSRRAIATSAQGQLPQAGLAPVVGRLRAESDFNEANARMRKLIEQHAPEVRSALQEAYSELLEAVEGVRDQLQSDWRAAKSEAEAAKVASGNQP